ncbi:MAG: caspase family protein [Winogradskyella sp.]|uniref:caspase family protein n=1 Tax=Winogradskyella sp. TaxID=1883156 RepID=UPI0025D67A39|nr:caspase family protein [Winogradskyella sp.]NRB59369.1 caspase family protein [Winogradskyella sp.]
MKSAFLFKIYIILSVVCIQFSTAQKSKIEIQSAHAGHITFAKIDSVQNVLVSYGSFDDKSVKFWDLSTGNMMKVIDNDVPISNIQIDADKGLTYISNKYGIKAISNKKLSVVKEYKIQYLKNFVYFPKHETIYYVAGTEEFNGVNTFYVLDITTGKHIESSSKWPSQGYPNKAKLVGSNNFIEFKTNFLENIYFDPASGQFVNFNSNHLGFFSNYDLLYADIVDEKQVKLIRYNARNEKVVWEKLIDVKDTKLIGRTQSIQAVFTLDESGIWVMTSTSDVFELDAKTGEVKGVMTSDKYKTKIIADNNYVYILERTSSSLKASGYFNKYKRYSNIPLATYGYSIFNANRFEPFFTSKENGFVFNDLSGNIGSFSINPHGIQLSNYLTQYNQDIGLSGKFKINEETKQVFYCMGKKEGIKSFKLNKTESFKQHFISDNQKQKAIIDSKDEFVIVRGDKSFDVYDNATSKGQTIAIENVNTIVGFNTAFSEHQFAILLNDEVVFDQEYKRRIDVYNKRTKKLLWQKEGDYDNVMFIGDGKQLAAFNISKQDFEILNAETGKLERSFKVSDISFSDSVDLNPSESFMLVSGYRKDLSIYNLVTGEKMTSTNQFNEDYSKASFINDDVYMLLINGHFRFYNVNTHQELLRLYIFLDNEWLAHAPNGQFEGSQKAWNRVIFTKGTEVVPLNRVFTQFYTPNLVYNVLQDTSRINSDLDISKLNKAPVVSIDLVDGKRNVKTDEGTIDVEKEDLSITLSADAFNDDVKEIRLYQNGKRILLDSNLEDASLKVDLQLIEGENKIEAIAVNSQDTESAPRTLRVRKRKKAQEDNKNINLHLVTIGIDKYKNPKYNLNYAVADAEGFNASISSGIKALVPDIITYEIKDSEANKKKIISTLETVSKNAKQEDILIFYFAGHGVMSEGQQKEFYLIPHDLTQFYGNDDALKLKGVSAAELKALSSNILAQKQLFVLDACQSAGALNSLIARGAAEEKAIAQLARSTGTHWLTASGSEQFATEFAELGHGAFTYALLEALSGKADSGDSKITVNEIKAYIESRVPELSEQYKGTPQYPSSFGFGQDFPVSVKQ